MGLPPAYALLIDYAQQTITGRGSTENTIIKRLGLRIVSTVAEDNPDRSTLSAKENDDGEQQWIMGEKSGVLATEAQCWAFGVGTP